MLPPREVCEERIRFFKKRYPRSVSDLDEFWKHKEAVEEKERSILDDNNLKETAKRLGEILRSRRWGMARRGVASNQEIEQILRRISPSYEKIRYFNLGCGEMGSVRGELALTYEGLCGITNTIDDDPDVFGSFLITGKSKVLMFIWGQTPGFDKWVRDSLELSPYNPPPYCLPHVEKKEGRYTSQEFCDIIEELDRWVQKWPDSNGGIPFQSLEPSKPVGHIIDMVCWLEHKEEACASDSP